MLRKSGFTVIELLIVVAILGILAMLLFGAVKGGGFGSRELPTKVGHVPVV